LFVTDKNRDPVGDCRRQTNCHLAEHHGRENANGDKRQLCEKSESSMFLPRHRSGLLIKGLPYRRILHDSEFFLFEGCHDETSHDLKCFPTGELDTLGLKANRNPLFALMCGGCLKLLLDDRDNPLVPRGVPVVANVVNRIRALRWAHAFGNVDGAGTAPEVRPRRLRQRRSIFKW
jgi:hypothetical protein